jgi:hypothetical protein
MTLLGSIREGVMEVASEKPTKKPDTSLTIRLTPDNQERIEFAEKLGFTKTLAINEGLRFGLRPWLQKKHAEKAKDLKELINSDVP